MTAKGQKIKRDDDIIINVGKNIRKYRQLKGLSAYELAPLCGIDRSTLSQYENGNIEPRITSLNAIAKSLDIKLIQLFDE